MFFLKVYELFLEFHVLRVNVFHVLSCFVMIVIFSFIVSFWGMYVGVAVARVWRMCYRCGACVRCVAHMNKPWRSASTLVLEVVVHLFSIWNPLEHCMLLSIQKHMYGGKLGKIK